MKFTVEEARRLFKNWKEVDWHDPNICPVATAKGYGLYDHVGSGDVELWRMSSACNPWLMDDSELTFKLRRQDGRASSGEEAISWMVAAGLLDAGDAIDAMMSIGMGFY